MFSKHFIEELETGSKVSGSISESAMWHTTSLPTRAGTEPNYLFFMRRNGHLRRGTGTWRSVIKRFLEIPLCWEMEILKFYGTRWVASVWFTVGRLWIRKLLIHTPARRILMREVFLPVMAEFAAEIRVWGHKTTEPCSGYAIYRELAMLLIGGTKSYGMECRAGIILMAKEKWWLTGRRLTGNDTTLKPGPADQWGGWMQRFGNRRSREKYAQSALI